MLTRLAIRNYALIDELDIGFPDSLVVISGETGAGKSILLGALSLLLGAKADTGVLRDRDSNCVVEGEFTTAAGQEYILRRVITPSGRSRTFVNDEPASMEMLKNLSSGLVDIHAQYRQTMLTDKAFQLSLLDGFAGASATKAAYKTLYDSLKAQRAALSELDADLVAARAEADYLQFQYDQLEAAHLTEGELETLEARQRQLSHAESISENLAAAMAAIDSEENSTLGALRLAESSLERVESWMDGLKELRERVASARIELKDISYELSSKADSAQFSPQLLQEVDDRLALIYDLMRKHGAGTVGELIAKRDLFASRLESAVDGENRREAIVREIGRLEKECRTVAAQLHGLRAEAAPQLASALEEDIRFLEIPQAIFSITLDTLPEPGPQGMDEVTFLFSANPGIAPRELSKCASGGELSRIMLAIKKMMSSFVGMPTMIFDEIDTGVSGSVAHKMGRMIVDMGRRMQIFAITHLPQVASKGGAHYLVYKDTGSDGVTVSHIRRIDGEEREREIARMLSGSDLTPEALANARVLLNEN